MANTELTESVITDKTGRQILKKLDDVLMATEIVDDLVTSDSTKALSAKQGKVINDTKLDKGNVYNGLDKTNEGYALDARQGKVLDDAITSLSEEIDEYAPVDITAQCYFRGVFSNYNGNVTVWDYPKIKMLYINGLLNMDGAASSDSMIITLPSKYNSANSYQYITCFTLGKAINFNATFRGNNVRVDNNAGSSSTGLTSINGWFRYVEASA